MLSIKYKATGELIPYVNNSRTHSEQQVQQVAASIKEFGFTNPLLIDEQGGIIAGHGRLLAAQMLKLDKVPTITLEGLTEAEKKAYVITDNKLALNAEWDFDLLKLEVERLTALDFDITLLGFDNDELKLFIEQNELKETSDNKVNEFFENEMIMKFKDENQLEQWYEKALNEGIECKIL